LAVEDEGEGKDEDDGPRLGKEANEDEDRTTMLPSESRPI
jgi:hypothetical protein